MYKYVNFCVVKIIILILHALSSGICDVNPGTPLLLTPFIKAGKIDEARTQSEVEPLLPNVFSNSGFFTVDEKTDSHLFFWFFKKSSKDWTNFPIILWLQGGPGCSSMFGLFTENGPFEVTKDGLKKGKYPWTDRYNVLYIDNPVGTGFSMTKNGYVSTEEQVSLHLHIALKQFFILFPELQKNGFYIAGESYAGKYIPAIAYRIYKTNPKEKVQINLKGLFIGNGYSDPENMMEYGRYLHTLGLIDFRISSLVDNFAETARHLIRNGSWVDATIMWDNVFEYIENSTSKIGFYDYINENFTGSDLYVKLLISNETRKAIHVGSTHYDECSEKVYNYMLVDVQKSVSHWISELLNVYPIMFYSGQLDVIVAHTLTSEFLYNLHWKGAKTYRKASRNKWYVDNRLAGYYTSAGNLKEALIRGAGHMAPVKKPKWVLNLLDNFVEGKI